jgi:hypothetical protein
MQNRTIVWQCGARRSAFTLDDEFGVDGATAAEPLP